MENKTLGSLLLEANQNVPRLNYDESLLLLKNDNTVLIDVREESEVASFGIIKNAIHIPRGLIEFKIEYDSPSNPSNIKNDTNILFYCAGGYRSALAAYSIQQLGFKNVFNIGGFGEWLDNGGEVRSI
ncbi:rhodanese-like domain-containing protein [Gammaproteobacteria bacterium]|jgi:rhodanese-related sulfurtransferase|nr:rhodanese-like domain-containing protein [Gammaproteobacteria bacterium]